MRDYAPPYMLIYCLQFSPVIFKFVSQPYGTRGLVVYQIDCDSITSESCSLSTKSCTRCSSNIVVHNIILFRFVHSIGWLTINLICYSNISKAPIFRQFYKLLEHFRLSAYAEFMCQNYVTNSEPYFY